MNTVTNEQSNLEKAVTSSLSNGPGKTTDSDEFTYFVTLLRIWWGTLPLRESRRYRKKQPVLVSAIEGILKHDRY